jgi:hypothetical protein
MGYRGKHQRQKNHRQSLLNPEMEETLRVPNVLTLLSVTPEG